MRTFLGLIIYTVTIASWAQTNPLWTEQKVKNYLPHMTVPEVEAFLENSDLVIIPVGALEQHGNHLPIGTDFLNGVEEGIGALKLAHLPHAGVQPFRDEVFRLRDSGKAGDFHIAKTMEAKTRYEDLFALATQNEAILLPRGGGRFGTLGHLAVLGLSPHGGHGIELAVGIAQFAIAQPDFRARRALTGEGDPSG